MYFNRAKVIYFVCVVVYFELENSGVSWCVWMFHMNTTYVLAGEIVSVVCRKVSE